MMRSSKMDSTSTGADAVPKGPMGCSYFSYIMFALHARRLSTRKLAAHYRACKRRLPSGTHQDVPASSG